MDSAVSRHADKSPSLSIREAENAKILIHCFGGCTSEQVCSLSGLIFGTCSPISVNRLTKSNRLDWRDGVHASSKSGKKNNGAHALMSFARQSVV